MDCVRRELDRDISPVFAELTGLPVYLLTVVESPELALVGPEFWCPGARRGGSDGAPTRRLCVECVERIWCKQGDGGGNGGVFVGACGRRCCSLSLTTERGSDLRLVIQSPRPVCRGGGGAGTRAFRRAVALLRVVARGLESMLRAEDFRSRLRHALLIEQAILARGGRLQELLDRRLPGVKGESWVPETTPQSTRLVEQVRRYLRANYHRPIGLGEVAAHVRRSPAYVSGLFTRVTSIPLHVYLQELRLGKARELLRDPCLTVAEVAAATGYASAAWFRHAFKKHTGLSPSGWRRSHQQNRAPGAVTPGLG
ncbi:MAG: helix-turn-helix transcriptional regulator [Verrucomicrobiales bacterium]|nr:helix-turn-helix transcriptional regulator [Verrucomicrobiales bacterium]